MEFITVMLLCLLIGGFVSIVFLLLKFKKTTKREIEKINTRFEIESLKEKSSTHNSIDPLFLMMLMKQMNETPKSIDSAMASALMSMSQKNEKNNSTPSVKSMMDMLIKNIKEENIDINKMDPMMAMLMIQNGVGAKPNFNVTENIVQTELGSVLIDYFHEIFSNMAPEVKKENIYKYLLKDKGSVNINIIKELMIICMDTEENNITPTEQSRIMCKRMFLD